MALLHSSTDLTPRLNALIATGDIEVVDGTYVGTASDGVKVDLGITDKPASLEAYLISHPTPESW